jgi:hypothetical protein
LDVHGLHVEPQRAFHGHWHGSVYRGANLEDCGYLLNLAGERILQPGDTVLLHDHLAVCRRDKLSYNKNGQMTADRALI